jgi:hypothetical protein
VPEEAQASVEVLEVGGRDAATGDVLPDRVAWRAVHRGEVAVPSHLRQAGEVRAAVVVDHRGRPLDRRAGIGVEVGGIHITDGRAVMIAQHAARPHLLEDGDDLVGLRPVPDDVAEHPDLVDVGEVCADRLEGRQVGVDVRQDSDTHASGEYTDDRRSACSAELPAGPEERNAEISAESSPE